MVIETVIALKDSVDLSTSSIRYTFTGQRIFPIGKPLPVIVKKKCIGIGYVTQFMVTEDSTRIEFKLNENISKESKEAYYKLYQTQMMDSEDEYETDAYVPGAMGIGSGRKSSSNSFESDMRRLGLHR